MKKIVFFIKLAGFSAIILLLIFQFIMPQYTTVYNAAMIDKYNRLKSIQEPKIILVGDSNIAYGVDSEELEKAFHMPVVNFGLHRELGQPFHTDMIKSNIREGDIVVIAPEDYNYTNNYERDCVMAWVTIENHYPLWRGIPANSYTDMILAFPTYLKRAIKLWTTNGGNKSRQGPYSRAAFNAYGDNVYPRPECVIVEEKYRAFFTSNHLSQEMQIYWNDYNEYVLSKGAILFMSCPPILKESLDADLQSLQTQLDEKLDFEMISRLEDYVYPLEYFYDTGLHLNETGKALRTKQLISDLASAMNR